MEIKYLFDVYAKIYLLLLIMRFFFEEKYSIIIDLCVDISFHSIDIESCVH